MLKYIIVPLSRNSASFCHYTVEGNGSTPSFIAPESLSKIVFWAMKENLSIQFVYPEECIPDDLRTVVDSIDHINIVPENCVDTELLNLAEVIVSDNLRLEGKMADKIYIVRLTLSELVASVDNLKKLLGLSVKVNVIITDIKNFSKESIAPYRAFLYDISDFIASETIKGNDVQLNLVTDRMMLSEMNNCNAGYESVAVSHEGSLYPCPAFMGDGRFRCGDIQIGLDAPNLRLFQIANAPICKVCDAFQCKRCVWLNQVFTHEVNTPGWQQCVVSHLEREAAQKTLASIRKQMPDYLGKIEIPDIDYIDPYTKIATL